MEARPSTAMVAPDPPHPTWSVGEVLRTVWMPDDMVKYLAERLQTRNGEGGFSPWRVALDEDYTNY